MKQARNIVLYFSLVFFGYGFLHGSNNKKSVPKSDEKGSYERYIELQHNYDNNIMVEDVDQLEDLIQYFNNDKATEFNINFLADSYKKIKPSYKELTLIDYLLFVKNMRKLDSNLSLLEINQNLYYMYSQFYQEWQKNKYFTWQDLLDSTFTSSQSDPESLADFKDQTVNDQQESKSSSSSASDPHIIAAGGGQVQVSAESSRSVSLVPAAVQSREYADQEVQLIFEQLVEQGTAFDRKVNSELLNLDNKPAKVAIENQIKKANIVAMAANVMPILDQKVMQLIENFLNFKKNFGSKIEKTLYKYMTVSAFIERCMTKRPFVFFQPSDESLLRDNSQIRGGFEVIGTDAQDVPLVLANYLSYDEMAISALLGVAVPTYFINDGDRQNRGRIGVANSYQEQGIQVAQVGARLEKDDVMEWQHMVVTRQQNTAVHGYGKDNNSPCLLRVWEQLYGVKFLTYEQAAADKTGRFIKVGVNYFDKEVYKKRMALVIKPFLLYANQQGQQMSKSVYLIATGLGLGVWKLEKDLNYQNQLLIDVYQELLAQLELPAISDINFSWIPGANFNGSRDTKNAQSAAGNDIKVQFSSQNPSAKLTGADANKLLINQYAWDGNSYPGNEYWFNMLVASGDPAAVCSSLASHLQNPEINPQFVSKYTAY